MINYKKIIIIGLLCLVGIAFLIPVFKNFSGTENNDSGLVCSFAAPSTLTWANGDSTSIKVNCNEPIEVLKIFIDDSLIYTQKGVQKNIDFMFHPKALALGVHELKLDAQLESGQHNTDFRSLVALSEITPKNWGVTIENTYPHRDSLFTQGLAFYQGALYEGTGDPKNTGSSLIAEMDLKSGAPIRHKMLGTPNFGEGIALVDDKLYQLTWQNQKCYVYDSKTFDLLDTIDYAGEGWGLCYDGKSLIMSDGTERITFRNPKTFEIERTIQVYTNEKAINKLNELEFVDGLIYANIWTTNTVAVIDPKNGKVLALIDATPLVAEGRGQGEVLNGIAYNNKNRKLYMTGKYWSKLFEVKINPVKEL